MIQKTITYRCRECNSPNIVKNGTNKCGNQQYHCKDCGVYRVLEPKQQYPPEKKQTVLKAYLERPSLRGLARIFGMARQTIARWVSEHVHSLPDLHQTVEPAKADDVLEVDEVWSFVQSKAQKRWLWTAICRRTGQIVAFVVGDRSQESCLRLYNKLPEDYKSCHSFSDFWKAYQLFPEPHQQVDKSQGQTALIESWNTRLRQRLSRYVRKTLSFSKSDAFHEMVTKWFIVDYNLSVSSLTT
jgi:IS1 family transposase/transposase-like protein